MRWLSGKAGGKGQRDMNEIPVLVLLLLFIIPLFIKRKDTYPAKNNNEGIKRFSLKPRIKNARNKANVYNNKFQSRIRKDA